MQVSRVELLEALEKVKPGLANKTLIDQSSSFVFHEGQIITYNDEISISYPSPPGLPLTFTCAVHSEKLYQLLSRFTADSVEIAMEDNKLVIKVRKALATLGVETEMKLPVEELGELDNAEWHPLPERFLEGIGLCSGFCSKNISRPVLTCVHVRKDGKIEGTDSYRILQYQLEEEVALPKKSVLIPSTSVQELVKYKTQEFAITTGWVHFRGEDGLLFSSRTFDSEFPDVIDTILSVNGTSLKLPSRMKEVLLRAALFSKKDLETEAVFISLSEGRATIWTEDESGAYKESVKVKYEGDPVEFSVDPNFLAEMLDESNKFILGSDRMLLKSKNWRYAVSLNLTRNEEKD